MTTDRAGREPLHYAAAENRVEDIVALIERGADPNARDRQDFTPLHFAAQERAIGAATALLDAGCEIDPVDLFGNTPLFRAVFSSRGHGDMIELLLSRGADMEHSNKAGQSPVGLARLIANYDLARFFPSRPAAHSNTQTD